MNATDVIHRLRRHQLWANARLLEACRPLSAEQLDRPMAMGQGSARATIVHLYAAEAAWMEAISGVVEPVSPFSRRFASMDELAEAWGELNARWADYYDRLIEAELDRPITKRSTSSGAGRTFATPAGDVLMHLFTHSQYTAAQLKNMLRQLGVDPLPDVMLITQSRMDAR